MSTFGDIPANIQIGPGQSIRRKADDTGWESVPGGLPTHDHDSRYYTESELDILLAGKADLAHNHDSRYFTESEVTSLLSGKADTSHDHDSRYYTETEVNALLAGKSNTTHTHSGSDITSIIPPARLGSGTPSSSNFLRGDGTWVSAGDPFVFKGVLLADVSTLANTTPVNVTGLSFSFEANSTYVVEVFATMRSPANTTGYGLQLDVSQAVLSVGMTFFHQLANTGTLTGGSSIADDASVGVSTGVPTANTDVPVYAAGVLRAGALAGTAQLRFRSEVAAIATMKAGSVMRVQKI